MSTGNSVVPKIITNVPLNHFCESDSLATPPGQHWIPLNGSSVTLEEQEHVRPTSDTTGFVSSAEGIRDETAPPVLLTPSTVIDTFGLPECARPAALDTRFYPTNGYLPCEDFLSHGVERISGGEERFPFSENEHSNIDFASSSVPTIPKRSPIMRLEEKTCPCCMIHDESFYRCHQPPTESSSNSEGSEEDSDSDWDSQLVTTSTFDTLQSVSKYENIRWPPPSQTSVDSSLTTIEPSLIVKKYGLSGSMLLKKQRLCLADPEPIRIDPRNFRAAKNQERTVEMVLSDCTERVDFLLDTNPTYLPLTDVVSPTATVLSFSIPLELTNAASICTSFNKLHTANHANPVESLFTTPSVHLCRTDSAISSIVDEYACMTRLRDNSSKMEPIEISKSGVVNKDSLKSDVCAYLRRTLSTSDFEKEEEKNDVKLELPLRPLVTPPADLSSQLKENINQVARHKDAKLASDDNQLLVDPRDTLKNEGSKTDSSTSNFYVEQMAVLNARLSQIAREMKELATKGAEKMRTIRELENTLGLLEIDTFTENLPASKADFSQSPKNSPKQRAKARWRWVRPKRLVDSRSSGSGKSRSPTLEQGMNETSDRKRLFAEFLAVISDQSKLVTQEAVIMAELRKIELEENEKVLKKTLDSIQHPSHKASHEQSKVAAFRRHGDHRFRKKKLFMTNTESLEESRIKSLLDEISKEKAALTAVQAETIQRANLQQLSVHAVLNHKEEGLRHVFLPSSHANHYRLHRPPSSAYDH